MDHVLRQRGVVYDVRRAMGAPSINWRPDYSPALMRRELDIIRADLHANAVRLGGRDPRRLLAAAEYAASIGLDVWIGPELWNATPKRTLHYIAEVAAAAEPLLAPTGRGRSRRGFRHGSGLPGRPGPGP